MTEKRLYDVINEAEPRGQSVIYKGIPCTARTCVTRLNRLTEANEQLKHENKFLKNRIDELETGWEKTITKRYDYDPYYHYVIDTFKGEDLSVKEASKTLNKLYEEKEYWKTKFKQEFTKNSKINAEIDKYGNWKKIQKHKRFMVDDAGTLIDIPTRNTYDIVEEVLDLLNEYEETQKILIKELKQCQKQKNLIH